MNFLIFCWLGINAFAEYYIYYYKLCPFFYYKLGKEDEIGIVNFVKTHDFGIVGTLYLTQMKFSDLVMIHGQIPKMPKGTYSLEVHAVKESENQCPESEGYSTSNQLPVSEHTYKVYIKHFNFLRFRNEIICYDNRCTTCIILH